MFIVAFGLTGIISDRVYDYFKNRGFKRLRKAYYTDADDVRARLLSKGETVLSSLEYLEKNYDYKYRINKCLTGFNKADFDSAVKGNEDLFARISCLDIDFLKSLKASYGKYVTIVYTYIDDITLETLIKKYKESEWQERLAIGKKLKNVYLSNINLFDNVVLYGGEKSVFNSDNLFAQFDGVVDKARNNEVLLNSQRKVQLPYVGAEDYIFVSYSHLDKIVVEEKLHMFQRNGYRVWYDSGMKGGEDWKKVLREKIKYCKNFVIFTSRNSVQSEDVKIEIVTADIYEKKIIIVRLDDSKFEGTIGNTLHTLHAIDAWSDSFEKDITGSLDSSTVEAN